MKEKEKGKKEFIWIAIIIFIFVVMDQILKIFIVNQGEISLFQGAIKLHSVENTGGAFGIGQNSTFAFIVTNLIVLGIIFKFMTNQNQMIDMKTKVFLSFILAGGISNVMDRLIHGHVIDVFDVSQIIRFPVFNLADVFILVGWVCLAAVFAAFTVKEMRNRK